MKMKTSFWLYVFGSIAIIAIACRWAFVQVSQMGDYCTESVGITSVTPVYEDNGEEEDEAFVLVYADGTQGLIDDGEAVAGQLCRKQERMTIDEGNARGLRQIRTYLVSDYTTNSK